MKKTSAPAKASRSQKIRVLCRRTSGSSSQSLGPLARLFVGNFCVGNLS